MTALELSIPTTAAAPNANPHTKLKQMSHLSPSEEGGAGALWSTAAPPPTPGQLLSLTFLTLVF